MSSDLLPGGAGALVLGALGLVAASGLVLHAIRASAGRRMEALRASQRRAAVRALVAGVAHEVNNPLTYVFGGVEMAREDLAGLLRQPDVDERTRALARGAVEGLDRSLHGLERIAHVARGLHLVARAGDGQRRPAQVNGIVEAVLAAATGRIGSSTVVATDLRATRRALANEAEIRLVVLSLVLNAADAVGARPGRIEVRTRDEGRRVLVEVADTGDGIPPEAQRRLFEPFFTTKPRGGGFGLPISQRIVQEHGGAIAFETAPGRGTTFRVELPAAQA